MTVHLGTNAQHHRLSSSMTKADGDPATSTTIPPTQAQETRSRFTHSRLQHQRQFLSQKKEGSTTGLLIKETLKTRCGRNVMLHQQHHSKGETRVETTPRGTHHGRGITHRLATSNDQHPVPRVGRNHHRSPGVMLTLCSNGQRAWDRNTTGTDNRTRSNATTTARVEPTTKPEGDETAAHLPQGTNTDPRHHHM